jgi:hypothetical protein
MTVTPFCASQPTSEHRAKAAQTPEAGQREGCGGGVLVATEEGGSQRGEANATAKEMEAPWEARIKEGGIRGNASAGTGPLQLPHPATFCAHTTARMGAGDVVTGQEGGCQTKGGCTRTTGHKRRGRGEKSSWSRCASGLEPSHS